MAPSWASTAHVGLAATAVRPTRHSDHLAEIHSLSRGTDCGVPSDRILYSRTSSALVALLSTDKCDHKRPAYVCVYYQTYNARHAAAARDGARRGAAEDCRLRRRLRQDEAVQTTPSLSVVA
ncbi:hypothetical protein LA080_010982 [Diaporthe eres]|nr:hypothetical protein LA080_010982 [Diaporthe eres]